MLFSKRDLSRPLPFCQEAAYALVWLTLYLVALGFAVPNHFGFSAVRI